MSARVPHPAGTASAAARQGESGQTDLGAHVRRVLPATGRPGRENAFLRLNPGARNLKHGHGHLLPRSHRASLVAALASLGWGGGYATPPASGPAPSGPSGKPPAPSPFTDYTSERPGKRVKITVADLPAPHATKSADNPPRVVKRPKDAWPKAPDGFKVELFANGLAEPAAHPRAQRRPVRRRERGPRPRVPRPTATASREVEVFATGLNRPFGIAFYPPGADPHCVYVGNTDSVVRFPYKNGDTKASGAAETIVKDIPSGNERSAAAGTGRATSSSRPTARRMFVSVGSRSNVDDRHDAGEKRRADILAFDPDGKNERVFASGIRNPVGLATHPKTGQLWTSVNERDALGDNLVPDYITHVEEGGFYGWPWYYLGPNQDPRHKGKHPELKDKVIVPDVLLQSHMASLDLTFYDGNQFPTEYHRRRLRRRARLVEPRPPHRLQGHPRADEGRQGDRRVRGLPRRLRHHGRQRLGPPGGRGRGQGRLADGDRRRLGHGLAGQLSRQALTQLTGVRATSRARARRLQRAKARGCRR